MPSPDTDPSALFWDGILRSPIGRPLRYRLLQDPTVVGTTRAADFSAEDVLHMYDPNRYQLGRGIPWGYRGANAIMGAVDMRSLDMVSRQTGSCLPSPAC